MTPASREVGAPIAAAVGLPFAALLALGPLELSDAWLPIGPLRLTTAELLAALAVAAALAGALAAWRLDTALAARLRARLAAPVVAALLAWGLLNLASGMWATVAPIGAFKAGARVCGGVALALVALAWGAEPAFRRRAVGGLLAGVAAIALLAVGERWLGQDVEPLLRWFRAEPTWMLGEQRLSTVFDHANTLAAYLELTLPVVVVVTMSRRRLPATLGWLCVITLIGMLGLTYSRAGLLAGLCSLGALAVLARRALLPGLHVRAGLTALGLALAFLANPEMRGRLGFEVRSYDVSYRFDERCLGPPGAQLKVPVWVHNRGAWPLTNRQAPGELAAVHMPADAPPSPAHFRYLPLPALDAGEGATLTIDVTLPVDRPSMDIVVDIRRKNVLWLSSVGVVPGVLRCRVDDGGPLAPLSAIASTLAFDHRPLEIGRSDYWRAAVLLVADRPLLGHGADRFRQLHARFVPFGTWDARARAHSLPLETAADLGLLGLLTLGTLALVVVMTLRRAEPTLLRLPPTERALALGLQAAVIGFTLHGLVDFFLAYTDIIVVAWPLLGLALALAAAASTREEP